MPPSLLPFLLVLLALVLLGLAAALGYAWARRRSDAALQQARSDARAHHDLLDGWRWQTDAQHRLSQWHPPADAGDAAWADAALGEAVWTRFGAAHADSLRARFEAHQPLSDLVLQHTGDAAATGWRLRGVPRFDAQGRFAGHIGTAQRLGDEFGQRVDRPALDALFDALPGPVWMADTDRRSGSLQVRRSNAAADRLIGPPPLEWTGLQSALPAPLGRCVGQLGPGGAAQEGPWSVHLAPLPGNEAGPAVLLALLPRTDAAIAVGQVDDEQAAFSYTVSHDLRAPIRVVEGFTRILKEDYGRLLDRIGNDHLDRVLGAAARMNSMIDALLALARLSSQPLSRQPVNLSQLAGFVIEDLRRQQPDRQVDLVVQPGLSATGDPTLLRLVLENLLGNAWKYSGKCARARIEFCVAATSGSSGRPAFAVRDNGAGFDMRFADRLFGVFQRLHSANDFPGTGVGLASVRRIVRRHGGDVWGESEVGQGACFYFTLGS